MKRKMIGAALALAMSSGVAYAVEPGSLFDSPANWTPKAWTSACYVCELDRQPQADICHPDFTKLKERTVDAVRATLEALGAEFTNGDAPGVKIRAS
jgi:hypothetical protein